jgi:selenide,water dikinase
MTNSQHTLVERLRRFERLHPGELHAATDITGFGLLGHLSEMLGPPTSEGHRLQLQLDGAAIPALPGAFALLEAGHSSSLAPANRRAWSLLDGTGTQPAAVALNLGAIPAGSSRHRALLELLVDPQTCGPLLLAVGPALAEALLRDPQTDWRQIGTATPG